MTTTKTDILPGHMWMDSYPVPYSLIATHLSTPAQLLHFSGSPPWCPPTSPVELCAPSLVAPVMGSIHTPL